jgi:tRNA(fMet)-specific endonuclease VapC
MICLDTNAVIEALAERRPQVRRRFEAALVARTPLAISSIVLFELRFGIAKSNRSRTSTALLNEFLSRFAIWPFEAEDAAEAGEIRAGLERAGTPVGPYDILIAAQARRRGSLLVTANQREFARVPGLRTEDWAAG